MEAKFVQYATKENDMTAVVEIGDKRVVLKRIKEHQSHSRCYVEWDNVYSVVSSDVPVDDALLKMMKKAGVFPSGQISQASLDADGTIRYWGCCDSGD